MGEKSIKSSELYEYVRPNYIFLKIIPNSSIRNYDSGSLITVIASLYKTFDKQVKIINNKLFFESNAKMSFYIYMEAEVCVDFYFIVPEKHYTLFKEKIINVWNNKVTIQQVDELPRMSKDCTKYYMTYKKQDALSLSCDKRNNVLLNQQINTLQCMKRGDKIAVLYNFFPMETRNWKQRWDRIIENYKNEMPVYKPELSLIYACKVTLHLMTKAFDFALECISLNNESTNKNQSDIRIGEATRQKRNAVVVQSQIICMSESDDKVRENNNALSLCTSYECLDDDNKLVYKKIKKEIDPLDKKIKHANSIVMQPKEAQNFISIPGLTLLSSNKYIEHINILETKVPDKLQTGYIYLGDNLCRGVYTKAYLRDEWNQGNLPLVAIGEQGSGKTTFLKNYVKSIMTRNEGCIVIDFIKNCELSESIQKIVPKNKLIVLDMLDMSHLQGFGYNELKPKMNRTDDILDVAFRKAQYIGDLVNALNVNGDPISSSMDRFLTAAATIVSLKSSASLKDVVRCLNDFKYREAVLGTLSDKMKELLSDEIVALTELNEISKDGEICGTRTNKIEGINHRINLLKKDLRLKTMFNKSTDDNLDLVKAMDEGKIILVKMPQMYFTKSSINVLVTYFMTKIWAAMLVRGGKYDKPKRFHTIVDEIFQAPTAMSLLNDQEILPQTRKFGAKYIFTAQYLGQIKMIDQTLRSAGASYMLMKGSGKANFEEFKDELHPYTLDDLEAMPQYHSLNLINYEDGRAAFITKLPPA